MELIIGGCYQGKLAYVEQKLRQRNVILDKCAVLDGAEIDAFAAPSQWRRQISGRMVLNHLHLFVKNCVCHGHDDRISMALALFLEEAPELLVVCDEVGCGVVPSAPQERAYREAVGRALCFLAQRADSMERVIGGIPMRIK
ncbi:bifunctional adenosylcobinamide kinase/adenosylcobinamide-phosphate guanylyltransferase [Lachnospiraceae bacterium JLR.KK008]